MTSTSSIRLEMQDEPGNRQPRPACARQSVRRRLHARLQAGVLRPLGHERPARGAAACGRSQLQLRRRSEEVPPRARQPGAPRTPLDGRPAHGPAARLAPAGAHRRRGAGLRDGRGRGAHRRLRRRAGWRVGPPRVGLRAARLQLRLGVERNADRAHGPRACTPFRTARGGAEQVKRRCRRAWWTAWWPTTSCRKKRSRWPKASRAARPLPTGRSSDCSCAGAAQLEAQLEDEALTLARVSASADAQEGIAAMVERRKPEFRGADRVGEASPVGRET